MRSTQYEVLTLVEAAVKRLGLRGLESGVRPLDAPTDHYLGIVLRLRAGTELEVYDPETGAAAMAKWTPGALEVGPLTPPLPTKFRTLWFQGLAKGDKNDNVVQDATELGVDEIHFVEMDRSITKLEGPKRAQRIERWVKIAESASAQSKRRTTPAIRVCSFEEALIHSKGAHSSIVLYEGGGAPLWSLLEPIRSSSVAPFSLAFWTGPEGGFSSTEIESLTKEGFSCATLGPTILRTETVVGAVLGAWMLLRD
ncbi:MAG: 16S rRNA (uracil(1498)-N(3))-methyltransferase [Polyangiaceae bacterium]|nr:16S rRNA (uracil(1498)-N(3))-methyltransferase [Polyangiaceae bacterium]